MVEAPERALVEEIAGRLCAVIQAADGHVRV
jgi:hypothetical protein